VGKEEKRGLAFLKKRGKIQALCFQTFKSQEKCTVKLNAVKYTSLLVSV
jgi:hypothetical protein